MSARRKHVRAHARDVEVEVDGENDLVCRVEEIKGGNVIEVTKPDGAKTLVRIPSRFANIYFVRRGSFILCTGFAKPKTTLLASSSVSGRRTLEGDADDFDVRRSREGASTSSGKVTGELKRVLTREQIKSVKERALWPERFANDDTEYTNKISSDVRRTITPDDLLKVEEKLRIESGGKKKSQRNDATKSGAPTKSGFGAEDGAEDDGDRIDERSFSEESSCSSSDDSRPPLHKNTNRRRPSFPERSRSSSESSSEGEEESSGSSSSS